MFPVASIIVIATLAVLGFAGDLHPEEDFNQAPKAVGKAPADLDSQP
jgi:hypothetical protein